MLIIEPGIKNGEILRGPDSRSRSWARTNVDAYALGIGLVHFDSRIPDRLYACCHAKLDEGIHASGFLWIQVLIDVKPLYFPCNAGSKRSGVEVSNPGDARTSCNKIIPSFRNGIADGGNDPQAGNHDSAL
jgi:hypothetical protein